jgi:hypothetical protein
MPPAATRPRASTGDGQSAEALGGVRSGAGVVVDAQLDVEDIARDRVGSELLRTTHLRSRTLLLVFASAPVWFMEAYVGQKSKTHM